MRGTYKDRGKIQLENGKVVEWDHLSPEAPPRIPYGTKTEITITFDDAEYLNGARGIVWATYDLNQAETIRGALLAQNIGCEVREENVKETRLYLLHIVRAQDVEAAVDFVWRDQTGLRLRPDWWYPAEAENESFKRWVNAI
jgi:hypothetical protein